jgi:hypothetical protein
METASPWYSDGYQTALHGIESCDCALSVELDDAWSVYLGWQILGE